MVRADSWDEASCLRDSGFENLSFHDLLSHIQWLNKLNYPANYPVPLGLDDILSYDQWVVRTSSQNLDEFIDIDDDLPETPKIKRLRQALTSGVI